MLSFSVERLLQPPKRVDSPNGVEEANSSPKHSAPQAQPVSSLGRYHPQIPHTRCLPGKGVVINTAAFPIPVGLPISPTNWANMPKALGWRFQVPNFPLVPTSKTSLAPRPIIRHPAIKDPATERHYHDKNGCASSTVQDDDLSSECSDELSAEEETNGMGGQKKYKKKKRTTFSSSQLQRLEARFSQQKYLTKLDRCKLAQILGLTEKHVKTWYQNRRTKWKRECSDEAWSREREHAAAAMYTQHLQIKSLNTNSSSPSQSNCVF